MVLCLREGFLEILRNCERSAELQRVGVKPAGGETSWLFVCINKACLRMSASENPDHQKKNAWVSVISYLAVQIGAN